MKIQITTLSENTALRAGLLAEHGLSIFIETDEANILLDAGLSISAAHNADALGVDLKKVDKIVLSHGHHDHTGGLRDILRKMRKEVEVIAHPEIWAAKSVGSPGGQRFGYVGIPFRQQELENLGARFNLSTKPVKITENIMTTSEVPMVTDFEQIAPNLFVKEGNDYLPDTFVDDQALIIKTASGLLVIPGCAHRGIINILYYAQQLTGVQQIAMVLGGWHLSGATEERIWQTIAILKELGVQRVGVSHCTGLPAAAIMAHEFGDSFFFNNAGTRIEME